ncbi:MAG: hypothetical protein WCX08_05090 [Candidatus Buchananbacteria bacterium]|jgi:hypothetical protein
MADTKEVRFFTEASYYGGLGTMMISVVKTEAGIEVDKNPATMKFNGVLLIFLVSWRHNAFITNGKVILELHKYSPESLVLFDHLSDGTKRPIPIADIYEALK